MKNKLIFLLSSFIFLVILTTNSNAASFDNPKIEDNITNEQSFSSLEDKIYVGAGYQYNILTLGSGSLPLAQASNSRINNSQLYLDQISGLNVFVGYELNNKLAVELGYFNNSKDKSSNQANIKWTDSGNNLTTLSNSSLNIINLDAIANTDIAGQGNKLKALGIIGVSAISYQTSLDLIDNETSRLNKISKSNGIGLNIGFGFEYKFSNKLAIRTTLKYTEVLNIKDLDSVTGITVAGKYQF